MNVKYKWASECLKERMKSNNKLCNYISFNTHNPFRKPVVHLVSNKDSEEKELTTSLPVLIIDTDYQVIATVATHTKRE